MHDIQFVEKILASFTHEMQNVMAIIEESGALTEDILTINKLTRLRHADKLDSALENIQDQVMRGRNMMLMLNSFAHAPSDYPEYCDLPRFARQICTLGERMVHLRDCSLNLNLDSPPLFVRGNALSIMKCVYMGLALLLEGASSGDIITVSVEIQENVPVLRIRGVKKETDGNAVKPEIRELESALKEVDGFCRFEPGFLDLYFAAAPAAGGTAAEKRAAQC